MNDITTLKGIRNYIDRLIIEQSCNPSIAPPKKRKVVLKAWLDLGTLRWTDRDMINLTGWQRITNLPDQTVEVDDE